MLKSSVLVLAIAGAFSGAANASPMTNGEVRLFNVDVVLQVPASYVMLGMISVPPGASLTFEFFDGLNLTGSALGSFGPYDSAWRSLPGLLDGTFSLRATAAVTGQNNPDFDMVPTFLDANYGPLVQAQATTAVDLSASTSSAAAVPEPGSLLLVTLAGLALGATRRRSAAA